jgi:hypothetical protein
MARDYTFRPTRVQAPGDGWASPQPTDIPSPRPMYPTRRMGKTPVRRWFDAGEDQSHPALRCHVGLTADGCGREVEGVEPVMERRITVRVRRILYAFGWLVALALAVGAGWKV